MTTPPEIQPALAAEDVVMHDGMAVIELDFGGPCLHELRPEARSRHKIAALCLYGQPYGFDANDVRMLTEVLYEQRGVRAVTVASGYAPGLIDARMARIATLLPPEEKTS